MNSDTSTANTQLLPHYLDSGGSGPAVVFIHGLGGASTLDYARVSTDPGLAGYRLVLVDLIGSGGSDRPNDFDYSISSQADQLNTFLTSLDTSTATPALRLGTLPVPALDAGRRPANDPVVLFGHSMGGSLAISLAALEPSRIAGVILSEANLDPGGGHWSRVIAGQSQAAFIHHGYDELLAATEAEHNPWAQTLRLSYPPALHGEAVSLVAGTTPTWRDIFYRLTCPRFYIFGSQTLPDADFEELPRHGIETLVVADCGHNMAWENPVGLAAAIEHCLDIITKEGV